MVFCHHRNISRLENLEGFLRDSSRTYLREDCEKRIFFILSVILAKLRREDARDETSFSPDRMLEGELYFTHPPRDWRKLEEVPDEYNLYTSEWKWRDTRRPEESIEVREKYSRKHRYLIDHENRGLRVALDEIFPRDNVVDIIITEGITHSETRPGVYRHPTDVSRSYTRRSGDRDTDRVLMTVSDKSIHEKCFSASSRSREKYILPHRQYVESFVLGHGGQYLKKMKKHKKEKSITFLLKYFLARI